MGLPVLGQGPTRSPDDEQVQFPSIYIDGHQALDREELITHKHNILRFEAFQLAPDSDCKIVIYKWFFPIRQATFSADSKGSIRSTFILEHNPQKLWAIVTFQNIQGEIRKIRFRITSI